MNRIRNILFEQSFPSAIVKLHKIHHKDAVDIGWNPILAHYIYGSVTFSAIAGSAGGIFLVFNECPEQTCSLCKNSKCYGKYCFEPNPLAQTIIKSFVFACIGGGTGLVLGPVAAPIYGLSIASYAYNMHKRNKT